MLILEAFSRFMHLRDKLPKTDSVCFIESQDGKEPLDGYEIMMVAAVVLAGDLVTAENDMDLLDSADRYFRCLHGKLYNNDDLQEAVGKVVAVLEQYGIELEEAYGTR